MLWRTEDSLVEVSALYESLVVVAPWGPPQCGYIGVPVTGCGSPCRRGWGAEIWAAGRRGRRLHPRWGPGGLRGSWWWSSPGPPISGLSWRTLAPPHHLWTQGGQEGKLVWIKKTWMHFVYPRQGMWVSQQKCRTLIWINGTLLTLNQVKCENEWGQLSTGGIGGGLVTGGLFVRSPAPLSGAGDP